MPQTVTSASNLSQRGTVKMLQEIQDDPTKTLIAVTAHRSWSANLVPQPLYTVFYTIGERDPHWDHGDSVAPSPR